MLTVYTRRPTLADEVARLVSDVALPAAFAAPARSVPPADVVETPAEYRVLLDLPGVAPADLRVDVERNTLTVQAERKLVAPAEGEELHLGERLAGPVGRSFTLPESVDAARVEARLEHGVLTVILPKREEAKARTVPVRAA
jgi:HSP20 family protein